MPVEITYTCDMCKKKIEWNAYGIKTTVVNSTSTADAVLITPRPEPTYCSFECLGKSMQWYAESYDRRAARQ